ncbi:MAG: hypothetical protein OFPII_11330 [Osedax symbiont Rs1]|nr:MAG: hypothetical protein OFPII_11330 [Osedax symbiont Rs1]
MKLVATASLLLSVSGCISEEQTSTIAKLDCKALAELVIERSQSRNSIVGTLVKITDISIVVDDDNYIECKADGLMKDGSHQFARMSARSTEGPWSFQATLSSTPLY